MKLRKYQTVPAGILIYFIVMAIYTYKKSGGFPEHMWIYWIVELLIVAILYFTLKKQDKYRNR